MHEGAGRVQGGCEEGASDSEEGAAKQFGILVCLQGENFAFKHLARRRKEDRSPSTTKQVKKGIREEGKKGRKKREDGKWLI